MKKELKRIECLLRKAIIFSMCIEQQNPKESFGFFFFFN